MTIEEARPGDAAEIARIYNHYVAGSVATFEVDPVEVETMAARIAEIGAGHPYLVARMRSGIAGYSYLNRWNNRCAYKGTVESTVYVDPDHVGRGVGHDLYEALLAETVRRDYHAVLAGISLPNPASVRLHESFGFEKVAHFRETGYKLGRWIDVGFWELLVGPGRANSDAFVPSDHSVV